MKKLLISWTMIAFSLVLCGNVSANDDDKKPPQPTTVSSTSASTSSTGPVATSAQSNGNNNDNSLDVTANTPHQAPFVFAPDAGSTATCRVGGSAGGSFPFGGLVLSLSRKDTECDTRLTAKAFYEIGDRKAAHDLLCSLKVSKKLDSCAKEQ